ncbi:MAG TPA: protein translocase subunit SecD, partial [Gammaproteobacteria bacterium]|nr:protein translocase subunit SecD [Gammaproteobacteria bacterium]
MNRYPMWKYLLIIAITLVGLLYALPNLYPEDPALQISPASSEPLDEAALQARIKPILIKNGIEPKSMSGDEDKLLLRFGDTETQLKAFNLVKDSLDSNFVTALNLAPATPDWLRGLNAKPMYLGLDLRGGVHFLLEVDMKAAINKANERYQVDYRNSLREKKIRYLGVVKDTDSLLIKFRKAEDREKGMAVLQSSYRLDFDLTEEDNEKSFLIRARLKPKALDDIKRFALKQNITALRKRVNELGVSEPIIQQQGLERIVVQLPGVQDTARAKKILGATATLEFRLVDEQGDPFAAESSGRVPAGDRLYHERNGAPILLKRRVMLTGEYITDAASGIDQQNSGAAVFITLDGKGARLFSKVTGANIKRLMAVVFIETKPDGRKVEEVINVARIQDEL